MRIAYHLLVAGNARYLEYSIVCAYQLMCGSIDNKNIIVSIDDHLAKHNPFLVRILEKLGVTLVKASLNKYNKHLIINRVFNMFEDIALMVQLDVDCFWMGGILLGMIPYTENIRCLKHKSLDGTHDRKARYQLIFDKNCVYPIEKYDEQVSEIWTEQVNSKWIKDGYNVLFDAWIINTKWIYGAIIVYSRSVISQPWWKLIASHSKLTSCDETILKHLEYYNNNLIEELDVTHNLTPSELDLDTYKQEFVHVASDSYRFNPKYKSVIDAKIDRVITTILNRK